MRALFVLTVLLIAPAAAQAQLACNPETFQTTGANNIPTGFAATDKVTVLGVTGNVLADKVPFQNNTFSLDALGAAAKDVTLRWEKAGGVFCTQKPAAAGPPSTPSPTGMSNSAFLTQCVNAGAAANGELRQAYGRRENFVVIVLSDLGVCYASKHFSTEGDSLYIGYAREDGATAAIEFDKCEAASAIPKILATDLSTIKLTAGAERRFAIQWFVPVPQCFGTAVDFHLNKSGAAKFVSAHLTQYERYRATLQLGAAFTKRHIESFGLAPQGGKNILVSHGPEPDRGPEYIAAVVIYGLPYYLQRRRIAEPSFLPGASTAPARGVPYFGREPVHENGVMDRIGALLGVGMSQPGRRFVVGVTFEVLNGVNVFAAHEYTKLTLLNGYEPGQEFTGAADAIPLKDKWDSGAVIGISFDGRYATALFGKK